MSRAIILTYHAIEAGPTPVCTEPAVFHAHADTIAASGCRTVTVAELAAELGRGGPREPIVALTFDDGFASVVETAVPMLVDRGLTATLFCVAAHLGGSSDWTTSRPGDFVSRLADADALVETARRGFEIGSHGMRHVPLDGADTPTFEDELVRSRALLEDAIGTSVRSYAYPYGAMPLLPGLLAVRAAYGAACTTRLGAVRPGAQPHELPRIDAHYVRRPAVLAAALAGRLGPYLAARGVAARARRVIRKDYGRARTRA